MEPMNELRDLLKHEIMDLYSVEEQIIDAIPAMIEKAGNPDLKKALTDHLRKTKEHKSRLDKVRQMMEKQMPAASEAPKKKGIFSLFSSGKQTCKGMQGILEEGNKILKAEMTPQVMDAAIIASVQKVEHYEICGYGTARTYARELRLEQVATLLEQTLNEEYEADDRLTALAVTRINIEAEKSGSGTGDRSASGSVTGGRSGRPEKQTAKERTMAPEPQMEMAAHISNASSMSKKSSVSKSKPENGPVPRAEERRESKTTTTRTTAARKGSSSATASTPASSRKSGSGNSDRRSPSGRQR
jgi:ferritin-like metal-binding protein YciE